MVTAPFLVMEVWFNSWKASEMMCVNVRPPSGCTFFWERGVTATFLQQDICNVSWWGRRPYHYTHDACASHMIWQDLRSRSTIFVVRAGLAVTLVTSISCVCVHHTSSGGSFRPVRSCFHSIRPASRVRRTSPDL